MNRILNINLGGYAITIDDDAFEYLESYLQSIRRRFSESEGRDEILHDIETRMGELITGSMGGRTIVMRPDVEGAVQIMGKPEDFGADPIDNRRSMGSGSANSASGRAIQTGKRLFRDEEDATVGGVCSGLSAYFGVADPLWMRLFFVFLAFVSFGFWAPVYVLLWILVPPAKTAADRLAMRGEPINVDNIAREIETGFDRISNKVNEFGSGAKKKNTEEGRSFGNALAGGVSVLGRAFGFFVLFIAKFGALIAILVGVALFIALGISWTLGVWSVFHAGPYLEFFSPLSSGKTYFAFANLFFVLGIPLIGLSLTFVRVLFKARTPRWLGASLAVVWAFNLFSLITLGAIGAKGYSQSGYTQKNLDLSGIQSDTLRVERIGEERDLQWQSDEWWWEEGKPLENGKLTLYGDVEIRVRKSPDGQFRMLQTITARGANASDAAEIASYPEYQVQLSGNTLKVPLHYSLQQGQRWRNQRIRLFIEMPVGKSVVFDEKIYTHAAAEFEEYDDENKENYISRSPNRVFKMTNKGIICADCPRFGDQGYQDDRRYEKFLLEGNFDTEILQADDFSVEIEGDPADKALVKSIRTGDKLTLTSEDKILSGKVLVKIKTPVFTSLFANNTGNISLRGFEEGVSSISVRGNSVVRGFIDVNDLNITLKGKCKMDLIGNGGEMSANLSEGAVLEATGFQVREATVSATDGAEAKINAEGIVRKKSDNTSSIKVEGNATIEENNQ